MKRKEETKYKFEELSKGIISAAIDVHKSLGPGFLEAIYENAMKLNLKSKGIRFKAQAPMEIRYLGEIVGTHRLDLIIENEIIVELKAVSELNKIFVSQLRSYLKAADKRVGLLLNFFKPVLEIKRVVN